MDIKSIFTSHHKKVRFWWLLFILPTVFVTITFLRNDTEEVLDFGYTPELVSIGQYSLNKDLAYSNSLNAMTNFNFPQGEKIILPESQREPLYPILLGVLEHLNLMAVWRVFGLLLVVASAYMIILTFWHKIEAYKALFALSIISFSPVIVFYSQIFYPYVLSSFFFCGALFFLKGPNIKWSYAIIFLSLAALERNQFFLVLIGLCFLCLYATIKERRNFFKNIFFRFAIIIFLIVPILIRNSKQGYFGTSQILGYSLGYTYGDSLASADSDFSNKDYKSLVQLHGSDLGTLLYLAKQTEISRCWAKEDKKIGSEIVQFLKKRIDLISKNLSLNINSMFSHLVGPPIGVGNVPTLYRECCSTRVANSYDVLFLFFGTIGLFLATKKLNFYLKSTLMLYLISFLPILIIIRFDPRYRGPLDFLLSVGLLYVLVQVYELIVNYRLRLK